MSDQGRVSGQSWPSIESTAPWVWPVSANPKYAVVFMVGITLGTIIALSIEQQPIMWGVLTTIVIFDGIVFGSVITDILIHGAPIESEKVRPLIRLLFLVMFAIAFTPTLVPLEEITEGLLKTADQAFKFVDATSGNELPPGPSYMELVTKAGVDWWLFPASLLIGYVSQFPKRLKQ